MRRQWIFGAALWIGTAMEAQGDGKAIVERACAKCHGMASVARERNTRGRWAAIVDDMIARGADVSDADFDKVVDYLAARFGPKTNVNSAVAEDLAAGTGFSKDAAAAIVAYRQKNGPFKSLDDLKKVPSLDAAEVDSKKDRLEFGAAK
uniref:DNA uptake protein and related DNA-binding protein-like protein n=1 Tax=Solibacter usitatus (strain Ellin6076) TaxID=234267 RepID=Q026M9_SOLUE